MDNDLKNFILGATAVVILALAVAGALAYIFHTTDTDSKLKLYCIGHGKAVDVQYNRTGTAYVAGCK